MNNNKQKFTCILSVLLLTFSATVVALPNVAAQSTKSTYAYLGVIPNPVGVNQEVLLHVGITDVVGMVGDGWEGLSVTITKPDDTTETITDITTDSTGGTGIIYVPTMVGRYTLQSHFPEQVLPVYDFSGEYLYDQTYQASSSDVIELVVQEEPISGYPGLPLPTEYWTRPIDAQFREWASISGNWIPTSATFGFHYAPYNDNSPDTAHVLWTKQLSAGGLVGGLVGEYDAPLTYEIGDLYEGKFLNSAIIGGVLYYNKYEERGNPYAEQEVVAVDLHTGEELWSKQLIGKTATTTNRVAAQEEIVVDGISDQFPDGIGRRLAFGQVFYWDSFNYRGVYGLLWTSCGSWWGGDFVSPWMAFDTLTGRWIYTITNVPSGTMTIGPNGELLILQVNLAEGWMALWNGTKMVNPQNSESFDDGSWNPHGNVYNASGIGSETAWEWNVTIPTNLSGDVNTVLDDRVIGSNLGSEGSIASSKVTIWALSLEKGQEGTVLFNTTWDAPSDLIGGNQSLSWGAWSLEDKVGVIWSKELRLHYGVSLETGQLIWGPTESQPYLDALDAIHGVAYGKLLSEGEGAVLHCYDVKTGQLLWTYSEVDYYSEIIHNAQYPLRPAFVTDGKVYLYPVGYIINNPLPRNAPFVCLDVETGDVIWQADGLFRGTMFGGNAMIGDSIMVTMNTYDMQIYAVGKGPSKTTALIQTDIIDLGRSALVQGMVTDVSPGTQDYALTSRFPNGVPAISDESMSDWMSYVYKQFPCSDEVQGVEVVITTIDPNGNSYDLGTTTSDSSGHYSLTFEPEVEGAYTIIASFEGSESYYGSTATTYLHVDSVSTATPIDNEPIDNEPVDSEEPPAGFLTTELVIIAAVALAAVIGVAAYWMLKRK